MPYVVLTILCRSLCSMLACILLPCFAVADPATHSLGDELRQRQIWFGDAGSQPYVVSGCLPAIPGASLTFGAFACESYVRTATTGELRYSLQSSAALGPLTAGDGVYWLAVHQNTSETVAGWTRQVGTRYLWKLSATKPLPPVSGVILAQAVVTSGAIAKLLDMRMSNPSGVWLNVKDPLWGCKGDGLTDDTTCWQAVASRVSQPSAASGLVNSASVPEVIAPEGVYRHTDTIDWGSVQGLRINGRGFGFYLNSNVVHIKWDGAAGKPIWWFKNDAFGIDIVGLGFSGADEAIRFRPTGGYTGPMKSIRIQDSRFSGQTVASIWIGFPLADTTSDGDFDGYTLENTYFDNTTIIGVVANVKDNGYRLTIKHSEFLGKQAIVTQGFRNITLDTLNVVATSTVTSQLYPIYANSGGGYYNIRNINTENGLLVRADAWDGSGVLGATLENINVNSADTYAAVGSQPTIRMAMRTTLINVQVSSSCCVRHIEIPGQGFVSLNAGPADAYDNLAGGIFMGVSTPSGFMIDLIQQPNLNKGIRIFRGSDGSPTGNVFEVTRSDGASSVARIEAGGNIATVGSVTGLAIGKSPVAFASLGTPADGTDEFCSDCVPNYGCANQAACLCAASGSGSNAHRRNSVWVCY